MRWCLLTLIHTISPRVTPKLATLVPSAVRGPPGRHLPLVQVLYIELFCHLAERLRLISKLYLGDYLHYLVFAGHFSLRTLLLIGLLVQHRLELRLVKLLWDEILLWFALDAQELIVEVVKGATILIYRNVLVQALRSLGCRSTKDTTFGHSINEIIQLVLISHCLGWL